MTTSKKIETAPHPAPGRPGNSYRVAIVGAGNVKGKEISDVLVDRNFPAVDIKLLDGDDSAGKLEAPGDEVTFIQRVHGEQFDRVDFTFFAADAASTQSYWKIAHRAGSTVLDLTSALEDEPDATVRSPWIERQRLQMVTPQLQPGPVVVAHPVATVLSLILLRLQKVGAVSNAVAFVLEPASERGQKGMDELHEQTVNLLSFQPLPKNVFDTQVAFNLASRLGEQAQPALAEIEATIIRHFGKIAGTELAAPSLLLIQAPIFHGHALALHLKMQTSNVEAVSQALAGEHVTVTQGVDEAPSNVNAAGHGDILVSVSPDVNQPGHFWLWAAADNLRVAASNAVECAETLAASRPHGKIQ